MEPFDKYIKGQASDPGEKGTEGPPGKCECQKCCDKGEEKMKDELVFDLKIIFKNLTKIIVNVESYGIADTNKQIPYFYFIRNNFKTFLPAENIIYFGRKE